MNSYVNFEKEKKWEGPALPDIKKYYKIIETKKWGLAARTDKKTNKPEQNLKAGPCTLRTQYTKKDESMDRFF